MPLAIITGITGQDGSYLSKLLIEKGYEVIGLTRSSKHAQINNLTYLKIEKCVKLEDCDLSDLSSVINVITKFKPNEIYNLAAQSSVGISFSQPIGTIQFNILSVLNILEAIRLIDHNIRFYQASSSEMYGKVNELPINITTPMYPLSPYGISKATGYWTVVNYRDSYGLFGCNGVLFNHESYLRSNNFFVKKIVSECVRNKNKSNWKLKVGNIDVKRDFGYAPKYVEAMYLMLQQNTPKDYLICSGKSISLRKIIEFVFDHLNISGDCLEIDHSLFRPTDIKDIYGDNVLAKENLKWDYELDFLEVVRLLINEELKNSRY